MTSRQAVRCPSTTAALREWYGGDGLRGFFGSRTGDAGGRKDIGGFHGGDHVGADGIARSSSPTKQGTSCAKPLDCQLVAASDRETKTSGGLGLGNKRSASFCISHWLIREQPPD